MAQPETKPTQNQQPASSKKPSNKKFFAEDLLISILVAMVVAAFVWLAFNHSFVETYNWKEMSFRVAFCITFPFVQLYFYVDKWLVRIVNNQKHQHSELVLASDSLHQIQADATLMRLLSAYTLQNIQVIATQMIDNEQKLNYTDPTEIKENTNGSEQAQ